MDESILVTVRKACNLSETDDSFDGQLIIHTNSYLFRLAQIGIGSKGFSITGTTEKWSDFIPENFSNFEAAKSYVGLNVLLVFDPPQNASVLAMVKEMVNAFEVCLYMEREASKND